MPRYKFYAGCPACGNRKLIHWQHIECSSEEEIDENGDIHCLKCKKNLGFIMDLNFKCGDHDSKPVEEAIDVFQALAMMTDGQNIPSDFAIKISKRVLERLS